MYQSYFDPIQPTTVSIINASESEDMILLAEDYNVTYTNNSEVGRACHQQTSIQLTLLISIGP